MIERDWIWIGRAPTLRQIAQRVAERHGVTVANIRGPSQRRQHAWPRQEFMWEARRQTSLSLPKIGDYLARHHSTVLVGARCHEKRLREGRIFRPQPVHWNHSQRDVASDTAASEAVQASRHG